MGSSPAARTFFFLCISVWVESRYPLRGYARLVGAPNYAPSLRSVAGLLLALALQSRYEDTAPLPYRPETAPATKVWARDIARGGRSARVQLQIYGGEAGCPRRRRARVARDFGWVPASERKPLAG